MPGEWEFRRDPTVRRVAVVATIDGVEARHEAEEDGPPTANWDRMELGGVEWRMVEVLRCWDQSIDAPAAGLHACLAFSGVGPPVPTRRRLRAERHRQRPAPARPPPPDTDQRPLPPHPHLDEMSVGQILVLLLSIVLMGAGAVQFIRLMKAAARLLKSERKIHPALPLVFLFVVSWLLSGLFS